MIAKRKKGMKINALKKLCRGKSLKKCVALYMSMY